MIVFLRIINSRRQKNALQLYLCKRILILRVPFLPPLY